MLNEPTIINQTLNELKVEKHPDKTFIGRIAKGFDFLGYSFEPKGLSVAPKTLANFLERKTQLYEQGATVRRIGFYVRCWWIWVRAGIAHEPFPDHISDTNCCSNVGKIYSNHQPCS